MSYNTNPYVGKTRRLAVNDVRIRGLSYSKTALKYGVVKSTICKWVKRASSDHREFVNTLSSAPKHHPKQLSEDIVARVVQLRLETNRCAPILFATLKCEGVSISLSSVERILRRFRLVRRKKQTKWYMPVEKPKESFPGSLVQLDTIHYVRANHTRFYVYALIDTHTRLAYAEYHQSISQLHSLDVIRNAQKYFGFKFHTVQTDNGPEFRDTLSYLLRRAKILLRHSRVRKPNDNAYIERFNRTLQEECFEGKIPHERTANKVLAIYLEYYNKVRLHLGLNCQTPISTVSKVLT